MAEPEITPEVINEHGITPEEYERILEILGREPNFTELGIFSVMWSEHCSYKNTRALLKTFPTRSPKVIVAAGEENAGVIDMGDGLGVAFKIESHNHPSAVEPFQGAATGVGGIIRDIFTMGARPIANMNSLRFGSLESPNVRRLFRGVVAGIAHYGNCIGLPTVAGEVYFDPSYDGNPLVNAFSLGVLRHSQVARGAAKGVGNPVFYVGPATGRDGLAGAAFASQDLTEESAEQQRGAVQVGDPFMEKLCMEACLELLATGCVAGIQDMGAAGLTCSTCETAARGGTGIEIDLAKVPQRAPDMTPYEILLSESQERMLIIVNKGEEEKVKRIFDKWDLPWAEVGKVTDDGMMVVKDHGEVVASVPAAKLADEAPLYYRDSKEPEYLQKTRLLKLDDIPDLADPIKSMINLLSWPSIASKNWVYRQYDHMVRAGTAISPGSDAAVIRVKADSYPPLPVGEPHDEIPEKYLAMSVDCNGGHVYLDPYEGSKATVAEAARNLVCSGARPLGSTDNLNFGNPHNPELFWQLKESVRGLAEACEAFNTPVTGGNVSLYNQNPAGAIDPTPTVGMVGIIDNPENITSQWFKDEGDAVILLGEPFNPEDALLGLGGSALLQVEYDKKEGTPPPCDLEKEKLLQDAMLGLIETGAVKSAHDCSEGGLAVALAECAISELTARQSPNLTGADLDLSEIECARIDVLLFSENHGRVVITTSEAEAGAAVERAKLLGVPAQRIGTVTCGDALNIKYGESTFSWKTAELHGAWWNSISSYMDNNQK